MPPRGLTSATYTHRMPGWEKEVRNALETVWRHPGADGLRTEDAQ